MHKARLFHNPRCSKSRQALQFIQDCKPKIEFEIIEYLKNPPTLAELHSLFDALPIDTAHDMLRPKEAEYRLAKLNENMNNDDVLAAIAQYPKLLERPIFIQDNKAAIGRPLQNIEALING